VPENSRREWISRGNRIYASPLLGSVELAEKRDKQGSDSVIFGLCRPGSV